MRLNKICTILLSVIFLASCEKKPIETSLYHQAIPSNVSFVTCFNIKELRTKSGLNKPDDFKMFALMKKELEDEKLANIFDDVMKGTDNTGLNFDKIYFYGSNTEDQFTGGILIKIENAIKFEKTVLELIKEKGLDTELKTEGEYRVLPSEGKEVAFWNSNFFTILFSNSSKYTKEDINYHKHMNLKEGGRLIDNPNFDEFRKGKSDIAFSGAYSSFIDLYKAMFGKRMPITQGQEDMKGLYFNSFMTFENGEIKLHANMTPKEKVDQFYAKYPIGKKFNNDILKDFPQESFFMMKFAFNPLEYAKMLKKEVATSEKTDEDDYYYSNPYDRIQKIFENEDFNTVINSLEGDIMFNIFGFADGGIPIPHVGLNFTVKNEQAFKNLLALVEKQGKVTDAGKYYSMSQSFVQILFAYKNNRVFVTNSEKAIQAFVEKGYDKNLSTSHLEVFKKGDQSFYMNLDLDTYPQSVKNAMQSYMGRDYKSATAFLNIYKDLSFTVSEDNSNLSGSLRLKNDNVNSLKMILKNIDDNSMSMMR